MKFCASDSVGFAWSVLVSSSASLPMALTTASGAFDCRNDCAVVRRVPMQWRSRCRLAQGWGVKVGWIDTWAKRERARVSA